MPRLLQRIAAILLGTVAGLALDEGILRVWARIQAKDLLTRITDGNPGDRPLVAFVGDSNVWGLYVQPHETLARVVQRLSRENGARGIHTANFAVPGSPTWAVVGQTRKALELKPAVVVARCGINNYSQVAPGEGLGALESLRLVKVARNAAFNWKWKNAKKWQQNVAGDAAPPQTGGLHQEGVPGIVFTVKPRDAADDPVEVLQTRSTQTLEQCKPRMVADFVEMAELCEKAGAKLVIASYLAGLEAGFNGVRSVMLELDGKHGIVVSDCTKGMAQAQYSVDAEARGAMRARLLTLDQHPTALGYEVEARVLARTLKDMGVMPDYVPEPAIAPLKDRPLIVPKFKRAADDTWAFEMEGAPKDVFRLIVGPPGTSMVEQLELPLDAQPFLNIAGPRVQALTSVVAGEDGKARLEVPSVVRDQLRGKLRAACIVYRGGRGNSGQVMATAAIDL